MKFVKYVIDEEMYDITSPEGVNLQLDLLSSSSSSSKGQSPTDNLPPVKIYDFLRCLTTCHTVVREKNGKYRAESPDELALVEGIAGYNCGLVERGTASMTIQMVGGKLVMSLFSLINILPNSK